MKVHSRLRRVAVTGMAGALVLVAASCTQDLGTLEGGTWARALDINATGLIVGSSRATVTLADGSTASRTHAFVMSVGGAMQDIHGGARTDSNAVSVNDAGVVVGYTSNRAGRVSAPYVPFRWSASDGFSELPLPPGATRAEAVDVNNAGTILVNGNGAGWLYRPTNGAYEKLADFGFGAHGAALNDRDEVAGSVRLAELGPSKAAVWTAPGTVVDLEPGSSEWSQASDINNAGVVVGSIDPAEPVVDQPRALRWVGPSRQRHELGSGVPLSVNDRGLIVGKTSSPGASEQAVLWDPATGTVKALPGLSDRGTTAYGIDDGDVAVGESHAEGMEGQRAVAFDRYTG